MAATSRVAPVVEIALNPVSPKSPAPPTLLAGATTNSPTQSPGWSTRSSNTRTSVRHCVCVWELDCVAIRIGWLI